LRTKVILIAALCLVLPLLAFAADITGTVTNKTTNKPAAGDDVTLLKLEQGMQEVARSKTDAQGRFTLKVDDASTPHLVRVNHRNVNYHRPAPPGTTSVEVEVYDSAERLELTQSVDVIRLEADSGTLRATEMIAVSNSSNPPRTQMSAKNLEVVIPEGAKIDQAIAAGPGGMPVTSAPVPTGQKNHYAFIFPIRPGETRFQLSYSMPYNGSANLNPVILRPSENFAVSVAKGMQLTPARGSRLEAKGEEAGMAVYVAQNATPEQSFAFSVSGTGAIPQETDNDQTAGTDAGQGNRPGGGLGTPVNTPDPLYKYRWWIIAGVAIALVAGGAYSMSGGSPQAAGDMSGILKEEFFRLETERAEGKITTEEYTRVKDALDVLMKRTVRKS
jgi:hypothetical protein